MPLSSHGLLPDKLSGLSFSRSTADVLKVIINFVYQTLDKNGETQAGDIANVFSIGFGLMAFSKSSNLKRPTSLLFFILTPNIFHLSADVFLSRLRWY